MATKPIRSFIVNGIGYSFASLDITISCEATGKSENFGNVGFTAVNVSRERDRGEPGRGGHPDPLFKTRGQNKYTGTLKMYKSVRDHIVANVLGGTGYGDRIFVVNIQYLENGLDTKTIEVRGCTWDKDHGDNAKGTDPTEIEVNLNPLKVIGDGFDDVDVPLVNVAI